MKRAAALCAILASCLAAACASSASGAGGGGGAFADCYDEDCGAYAELYRPAFYLRTPSTPEASRGAIRLTEAGRPAPHTVDRSSATTGFTRSAAPRPASAPPAPSRPTTATVSRP